MAKAIKPTIRFAADFDAYKRELKRAIGQTDKFDRNLKGAGKKNNFRSIGKAALGAAAGIGAVAVAGTELKKSVDETVDLAKATRQLQRATGLSAEEASRLAAVLKVRGIGTDKLGRSFVKLAGQIESAKEGTGAAADNFRKLGVSQRDIQSGNLSRILTASADGFKKLGDGTSKAAIAQQLFGRNSRDLIPVLEGGGKALRDQLGLAPQLSQAQVEQAFAATKAQRQINLALMKVRTTIAVALLPYISKAANFISEMFEGGNTQGGRFAAKLKEIWRSIQPALEDLGKLAKAVFEFLAANPKLVKMAAYLGAVGLAVKAIKFGSAISGMSTFLGAARTLGGKLITSLRGSGTKAGSAAMSAAANSAADSAAGGVMTRGGRGKKFEKGGKGIGRWVGRGLAAGVVAGLILFGPQLAKELSDWFSRNLPGWLKALLGIRGSSDPRSPYFGAQGISSRSVEPGARAGAAAAAGRSASSPVARSAISIDSNSSPGLVQQRIVELEKSIATYENALAKVEDRTDKAGKRARDQFKEKLADYRFELSNLERRQQSESAIEGILSRIADLRIQAARAAADELGSSLNQRDAERSRLRNLAAAAEFVREQARLSAEVSTADRDYVSQRAELVTQRNMAATEATDPRVQARFARERESAQRDLARAEARGDLDAKDAALAQLAALEERYGANRAARLQSEIDELDRLEQERKENAQRALDELRLSEQERIDALKGEAIEAANTTAAIGALSTGLEGMYSTVLGFLRAAGLAATGQLTGGPQIESPGGVQDFLRALLGVGGFSLDTGEVPLFGGQPKGASKPTIPKKPKKKGKGRASGGFLASAPGALTLVGETGPEYVTREGLVLSGSRTQRMGSAGGVTLNVYPRTSANDPTELARALGWQLATR